MSCVLFRNIILSYNGAISITILDKELFTFGLKNNQIPYHKSLLITGAPKEREILMFSC